MMAAFKPVTRALSMVCFLVVCISCGENNNSGALEQNPDSMPVKKMSTDSNSTMPVHTPADSSTRIPNPYDTSKR